MNGLKRISIFLLTNFLVVLIISVIMSFVGIPMDDLWGLLILCAMFGMMGSFISLWLSKTIAKWSYKIRVIDGKTAVGREQELYNTIRQMATHLRIMTPQVGIYNAREVNAFATGASKDSALIAFSSQLLNQLDDEEVYAVAAHEMSHIINGDMVTMTLLTGVANTFVMFFARVLAFAIDSSMRDGNRRGGLGFMGQWIMIILLENVLMLLAYIPISAFSRWREYSADAGAARITNPGQMISALQKIEQYYFPEQKKDSFALAKINNHHKASLYATHPAIADRIKRLQQMTV
ncbi:MAG: protease HtpX [Candidatus Cloacimonetes bacterium HGW-Cloacimonetes-1]|jgi:heat shock protein HtpX|nr:MAG: protease HtpX [Candidatus Cloacimonetes bacterium HGW-Cloacimonetes-1]